jgi:hypothetical protein
LVVAVPTRERAPKVPLHHRIPALVYAFAIPIAVVVVALVGLRIAYADRALPGTNLAGTAVGGDDVQDIRDRLERLGNRAITVVAEDRNRRVEPAEAGLSVDVDATVDRVLDAGRDGAVGGAWSTIRGFVDAHEVEPVVRIDAGALDRAVSEIARGVGRRAFPGAIKVDTQLLEVTAVPPRSGRSLDGDDLRARLRRAFTEGDDRVQAQIEVTRVASREDVEAVAQEADDYLSEPVRLTGLGDPLRLDAARIAPVLALSTAGGNGKVELGTGAKALETFVAGVAARRDRKARDAEVSAPGRKVILDGKGEVSWRPKRATVKVIRDARGGRAVDRAASAKAIDAAIRSGEHDIRLTVKRTEPAVTAKDARSLRALIGTFTTRYQPGQPRVQNIRRMARTVDGTHVAPGAQFSLNGRVGPRTKAGGYVEAPFISDGNKIEPSIGGGVSQFSTTLYNAAYFAGLRIDTHTPHSLFIDRYPAGRESTLNYDSIDLKFTNDTDAPVLIRTFTDETSITVSLYGDNGGRRVRAEPGERSSTDEDFTITVTRVVRYPGGRVAREPFTTRYGKHAPDEGN